jgi:uncharacterized protein DUF2793
MTDTTNLALPCIEGSQAQKHVTHNDALRILDTLVQLAVADRDLTAPPGAPAEGQRWIVKAGATGLWAGHDNAVAAWQDGAWQYSAPQTGWIAFVADEGTLVVWNGTAWGDFFSTVRSIQNLALLGIGTTADTTNVLAAKLNNALFAAKTVAEGGSGDLRYKLSKAAVANTVSFLFQDNYSARAEFGLAGDDDFHVKVSADGTTWLDGIVIDRTTGAVSFPHTTIAGGREILTANRTYYVRTDGSDSNTGTVNSSGGAFLTIQKAIDTIVANLDTAGYTVTIQAGNGTYTGSVSFSKQWVGSGNIVLTGENTTGTILSPASGSTLSTSGVIPSSITVQKMKLTNANSSYCLLHNAVGKLTIGANIEFGAAAGGYHISLGTPGSYLLAASGYTISGGAYAHLFVSSGGAFAQIEGSTVTLTGTPAFSGPFLWMSSGGNVRITTTFSGSATGMRYLLANNAVALGIGAGTSYLPGNSAGSASAGAQYAL